MGQGVLLSAGADIDFMVHGVFSYEIFGPPKPSIFGVLFCSPPSFDGELLSCGFME